MLIHTLEKALAQGPIPFTRHRIDLIRRLVLHVGGDYPRLDHFLGCPVYTIQRYPLDPGPTSHAA